MRRAAPPALLLLVALAACGPAGLQPGRLGCGGTREVALVNASSLPVEQLYLGNGRPDGWGRDLLGQASPLPSQRSLALRLPGARGQAVRAVWVNGRAAEIGGLDGCGVQRIVVTDGAMRAE
jgi:hypothetical protein